MTWLRGGAVASVLLGAVCCATGADLADVPAYGDGGSAGSGASGGTTDAGTGGSTSSGGSSGSTGGAGGSTGGAGGSTGGASGSTGGAGGSSGGAGGSTGGSGGSATPCEIVSFDFSTCPGGFTTGGANNDWQCGAPTSGPAADHTGGGSLWGTNLAGNAKACNDSLLISPDIDLTPYAGKQIHLDIWSWFEIMPCACFCIGASAFGGAMVQVGVGGSWTLLDPVGGYAGGGQANECYDDTCGNNCTVDGKKTFNYKSTPQAAWAPWTFDLSAYAGQTIKLRFAYGTTDAYACSPRKAGWYLDDLRVSYAAPCQ